MTDEQITQAALALPSGARAQLADRLVESLDPLQDDALKKLWASEALRRLDEVRSGRVQPVPSDVALERVRNSIS